MNSPAAGFRVPDYHGGGLLNLVASIGAACGARDSVYASLSGVDVAEWSRARHLIVLLVDGLGADFLKDRAGNGFLHCHQVATLPTVCPATTAAAIPTLMSGLAPAAHALTGWHMYIAELDSVMAILPMVGRGVPLPEHLFGYGTVFQQLQRPSAFVTPIDLANSVFSQFHARGAVCRPYYKEPYPWAATKKFWRRREDMFGVLRRRCHEPGPPSFTYAYWPDFDHAAHHDGIAGADALACFQDFEARFEEFLESIRGTDTQVILTADHGFIDAPGERRIDLGAHPELAELLRLPLCGERRFAYCYVRSDAHRDFEDYIACEFGHAMEAWPRSKLLDERWFGPDPMAARLPARIGDYVLAMKDDWTIADRVPGEDPIDLIGVHGGLSAAEMQIPLCVFHDG